MAMSALTVKQPWDVALLNGKRVENRPTRPPRALLGQRIALHAGLSYDYDGADFIKRTLGMHELSQHAGGFVFATTLLVGYVERDSAECRKQGVAVLMSSPELEWALSDRWFFGPVGLVLQDTRKLMTPVRARGMQGFFPLADLLAELVRGFESASAGSEICG